MSTMRAPGLTDFAHPPSSEPSTTTTTAAAPAAPAAAPVAAAAADAAAPTFNASGPQGAPAKALRFRDKTITYDKLEQFLKCGECQSKPAEWDCKDCNESYCNECKVAVHSRGKRQQHATFVHMFICRRCGLKRAITECAECEGRAYCEKCNKRVHGIRGRYRGHTALESIQLKYNTDPKKVNVNRDEDNGYGIDVKKMLSSSRFPSEHAFVNGVLNALLEQMDPKIRLDIARELSPTLIELPDGGKIDLEELMQELKLMEGFRPPSGTPPPEGVNVLIERVAHGDDERGRPAPAPANCALFIDTQTQKLLLGAGVFEDSCVGWRRLSRMLDKSCLFAGATNTHGSTAELRRLVSKENSGPKMRTASVFASASYISPPQYSTAGVDVDPKTFVSVRDFIPRFVAQDGDLLIDEEGFNLGLLPALLCPRSFSQLFLSMDNRANQLYFFQFWTLLSKHEAVLERNAITKVQNVIKANALAAPVSPAAGPLNMSANPQPTGHRALVVGDPQSGGAVHTSERRVLTVLPKPDARARVPEIPGGILSPSAQDEVFLQSPGRTRQQRAPDSFVPTTRAVLDATPLTRGFLNSVYGSHRVPVATDDMVPFGPSGLPLFGVTEGLREGETWKILLAKAYSKMYGTFAALHKANPVHVLKHMTGGTIVGEEWGNEVAFLHEPAVAAQYVWWKVRAARRFSGMVMLFRATSVEGISVDRDEAADSQNLSDSDADAPMGGNKLSRPTSPSKLSRPTSATLPRPSSAPAPAPVTPVTPAAPASAAAGKDNNSTLASASRIAAETQADPMQIMERHQSGITRTSLQENKDALTAAMKPTQFPPSWGTEACAFERGNTAESDGGAIALFTRELLTRDASRLGVQIRPPAPNYNRGPATAANNSSINNEEKPAAASSGAVVVVTPPSAAASGRPATPGSAPQSWALTKIFQLGMAAGAERFTFNANSPHWTKELRDYFDFRESDNDLCYATPSDLATAYDTIVTCFNYVGAPSQAISFRLVPTQQHPDADWTSHILIALTRHTTKLRFEAEVFDFKRAAPAAAAQVLSFTLRKVHTTTRAALHPLSNIDDAFPPLPVQAVQQLIPALGQRITLADKFEVHDLVEPPVFVPGRPGGESRPSTSGVQRPGTSGSHGGLPAQAGDEVLPPTVTDEEAADNEGIAAMFVLTVQGQHRTDMLSGILSFNSEDVAFVCTITA